MVDNLDKKNCCGCHACANICPKQCISMVEDEEGFLYPQIDKSKCINCGLCRRVCPTINCEKDNGKQPKAYACFNKDEEVRKKSSSGGMFSVFAEYVLEQDGIVFGAGLNENFEVVHQEVSTKEDLQKLRMSKYVQSKIGDCYKKA